MTLRKSRDEALDEVADIVLDAAIRIEDERLEREWLESLSRESSNRN